MSYSKQTVLFIGNVWPEPNSSAAGKRMMQLLSIFQTANADIIFASAAIKSPYSEELSGTRQVTIALNCDSFDDFIKVLNPNIVVFDRLMVEEQFGWRVANICPLALRILDTEDLHCLRRARELAIREHTDFQFDDVLSEDVALREIASILRCDVSLIISEVEMHLLMTQFKVDANLLFYLPLFFECESAIKSFDERRDFVFIGNFHHKPNYDAVKYLKDSIWPRVRAQLKVNLHIYGAYPTESILQLNKPDTGFLVHGRANNARQVIEDARIMLGPLRFGAGLKGKLLEAMQYGTPSITTTIGAEGIPGELPWNGYVEDDPDQLAKWAIDLYSDQSKWFQMQQNGFIIIKNRFARVDFESHFIDSIDALLRNLENHRKSNFTGRMLQHHSMRSTEYMSRWINAKNQK